MLKTMSKTTPRVVSIWTLLLLAWCLQSSLNLHQYRPSSRTSICLAFESPRRLFHRPKWGVPRSDLRGLRGSIRSQDEEEEEQDEKTKNPGRRGRRGAPVLVGSRKRRNLIWSSAAALLSSVLAPINSNNGNNDGKVAHAGTLLEESETRRIEIFERNAPSVVFIDTFAEKQDVFSPNVMEVPLGTGSGFVWDKDGHIITNYHVVRNAKFAQIALITPRKGNEKQTNFFGGNKKLTDQQLLQQASVVDDGSSGDSTLSGLMADVFSASPSTLSRQSATNKVSQDDYQRTVFKATVVGTDPGKDIAVLKIEAPAELLYPITVGSSSGLKVGQLAMAIGNPFGLDHSLTVGVISGLGREVKSPIGRPISNVIQTDASINPGNSGGVLLDSSGRLIGMNTAIYSPSGASAGIGFAIPVNTVKYM